LFKEGKLERKVQSKDLYLGAIPWVAMQLILVAIVIFVPQTVTAFLDKEVVVDTDKVEINFKSGREEDDADNDPSRLFRADPKDSK